MPNLFSTHRCISIPHLTIVKTKIPPIRAKKTPRITCQKLFLITMSVAGTGDSQIVNVQPTPMELINGSTAAVAAAAKRFCTTYLPLTTSERICGITSVINQQISRSANYTSNSPAEYVFNPLNVPSNPTPAKKALITGTGIPPTSSSRVHA